MAQPTGVASGTVPQKTSTRRMLLLKWLGALQNLSGAFSSNDPKPGNTRRQLLEKIDLAKCGTGTAVLPSVPLAFVADTFLDWSGYVGTTPDHWNIYKDGVLFDTVAGGTTNEPSSGSGQWYVQGFDAAVVALTNPSNTITGP